MRRILFATAAAFVLAGAPAIAQEASKAVETTAAAMAEDPQGFATMAASSDMFEIESSRLALEKGEAQEIKDFAQHMIDDHTKASEELKQAAATDGIQLPAEMSEKHQKQVEELSGAEGEEFDASYLQMQLAAHREAVALFEGYAKKDGALADHAEKTLPKLKEHFSMVEKMAKSG